MNNQIMESFMSATGKIDYNMTNNYMFRYILQKYEKVLKGLVCSLLHLKPKDIRSIEIKNPINLAGAVSGKEFILDINILLNNEKLLNLEMQVLNEYNWPERSLSYLCRSYDQLFAGQDYETALPAIHIGFLDFTLHPSHPEFYATYQMLNIKNHLLYSDKFTLSVVDLNHIDLATEEDKAYGIDYWAALFKAETWEELRMLANNNEALQEAATNLYIANSDEIVRQQCRAREDAERRERTLERITREQKKALAEKDRIISEREHALAEMGSALAEKDNALAEKDNALAEKDNALAEKEQEILRLKVLLEKR